MSSYSGLAGLSATLVARNSRHIRELQRIGPQPWLYVGTYPTDAFTRKESPPWQNGFTFVPGRRVALRWGFDGDVDGMGVFDLVTGSPVSGDVAFNVNENTDEFEGVAFETFIPLELDVGVWSAAVVKLYGDDDGAYVSGDCAVFWPIVADPIP